MSISTTTRIPTSTTTLTATNTSSKLRGKVRQGSRVNGNMMPATGVESLTRTRELPRSTIREQAAKLRSPGSPTGEKMARVQAGRQVPDREELIVADSRVPSVVRTEEALPRWIAVVARQAATACPPNPRREVVEVPAEAAVAVEVPVEAVVVAAVAAAVEDDREVGI
jgi:hypothetical protein